MVFWKALDMYKTKIMRPYADSISVITQRERMPANFSYHTVKSTPSSIYDTFAYVLEYKLYWFSISVFLTLRDIMGLIIFVFGGNKERKNVTLNVVDVDILS